MAKLLDLTRANNIAISLKAFNDLTFRSLAEAIGDLDPDRKIVGERVQFLPNLLPTPKEVQATTTSSSPTSCSSASWRPSSVLRTRFGPCGRCPPSSKTSRERGRGSQRSRRRVPR